MGSNGTYHKRCPSCHAHLTVNPNFSFVILRVLCHCGTVILLTNPRYGSENTWGKFRRCLDCGDPIPPHDRRQIRSELRSVQWTCPRCWQSHRNDEPGTSVYESYELQLRHASIS